MNHVCRNSSIAGSRSYRGFMMVEVLLVVILVAVGLTVVMQSMTQALGATAFSSDYTMAAILADNAMARVMIERKPENERPAASDGEKFLVTTALEPSDEGLPDLEQIKVTMSWRSGRKDKLLVFESCLLLTKKPGA